MSVYDNYELVVGLEVHAQLLTLSKAYSNDATEYGASPNTNISAISLGLPGTLPVVNEKVVEYAVKLGLALKCDIRYENQYARKNYFYADLPKGYQITQDKTPICTGGFVKIKDENDQEKIIHLERIHMEEDAGKSMHDQDVYDSLIDLNRAGVPLVEIVTKPDFRSAKEAYNYLTEIRKLVRHLDICDGNMEEGSLRCDANISVRKKGDTKFGKRCEVKNMNSIKNVQKAIEFEFKRHIDILEAGGEIAQETRNFDAGTGTTIALRSKENAQDYRYFPEPDLPPVFVTKEYIDSIKKQMPPLPEELFLKYTNDLGLPAYDAYQLTDNKEDALYFEEMIQHTPNIKAASNWMMGNIKSYLNENGIGITEFRQLLSPKQITSIIDLIDQGKISNSAAQQVFSGLVSNNTSTALEIATNLNLIQESNADAIHQIVDEVLAKFPEKVAEYKNGKVGLIGMFMGEVMKASGGKLDPKVTTEIIKNKLS